MIYLIILILLLFLSYRYDYCRKEDGRTLWIIVVWVILILIAGLRYRIGTDSVRYEAYFSREYVPLYDLTLRDFQHTRYAPLYIILNSTLRMFTDDFTVFQFVHAIIVSSAIVLFFARNTQNVFFALMVFSFFLYFTFLTEVLRESLAVSVFLLAWPFFRENQWLRWYSMSVVAILFHTSAVIMLVLPVICIPGIRNALVFGKRTIIVFVIVCLFAVAIQIMFFKYIQLLAISENLSERAEVYSKSQYGKNSLNPMGMLGQSIRYIAYPLIALYFMNKNRTINEAEADSSIFKIEALTLLSVFVCVFSMLIPIMSRFLNYFFPFAILILSDFAYSHIHLFSKEIRFKFIYWWIFFLPMFVMQFQIGYMSSANSGKTLKAYMPYYPYSSRIEMSRDADREKWFRYQRAW